METRVYQSNKNYSITGILKDSLNGYKSSFYLAKQLAKRDIKAQYRQSILGLFWAFTPIIMSAAIWIFLSSTGVVRLAQTNIPYPLFVVSGVTIWSIFSDCLQMTIGSVNSNKSIITKINFEKEALITLGFIKLIFNVMIKLLLIIVLVIVFKVDVSSSVLWFVPLLLISMLVFISIGILITPIGILFNDVIRIIPIIMQIFMYITPIMFMIPERGIMKRFMEFNPLSYVVINLRNCLTGFPIQNELFLIMFSILAIVLFLISGIIYRIAMPIITERMSA